jgi:metallo-beta-lactamase family protein
LSIAALFQGGHELHDENARPFGLEPSGVDVVLLTDARLDLCGRLPLFCRQGFRGEIISTSATRDPARLVLLYPAHLHEEAARRHNLNGHRGGRRSSTRSTRSTPSTGSGALPPAANP